MVYETTRYHCSVCRTPHDKHAQALRCERLNHHRRTVWPSAPLTVRLDAEPLHRSGKPSKPLLDQKQ